MTCNLRRKDDDGGHQDEDGHHEEGEARHHDSDALPDPHHCLIEVERKDGRSGRR
jgi:hypothetical protein